MKIRIEIKHLKECKYCGESNLSWYDVKGDENYKLYKCQEGGDGHMYVEDGEVTHVVLETDQQHRCNGQRAQKSNPQRRGQSRH